ncbi:MAG TPA: glycoside hydrolase family 3 protein [Candidatus Pygmaiobacter gallistercoris]|nr:glycoside hydrolase family 3 protein [Candidatus Pygmaiobacter gallistercoris]
MKRREKLMGELLALFTAAVLLTGCVERPPQSEPESSSTPIPVSQPQSVQSESENELDAAEQLLAGMTLRQKVGQLFLIRPESLCGELTPDQVHDASAFGVREWTDAMTNRLAEYPAGGVVLFGKNLVDPQQLAAMMGAIQRTGGIPLLVGIDEEGGTVARLANSPGFDLPRFEEMAAIGAQGDPDAARQVGGTIGGYLRQYGFQLDFAPVADLWTNPKNTVIGTRAFGSDPALVSRMVKAAIEGFHEQGILTCIKHFPGHGDTEGDSHAGYVVLDKSWQELKGRELIPFVQNFENTDLVMVAHILLPQVTDDGLPASLSAELISGRLRGELGYDGLVVTDSLAMGAITQQYTSGESAVLAFAAGADLLLMPQDYTAAFESLLSAVERGEISQTRLDESVLRILRAKQKAGLI